MPTPKFASLQEILLEGSDTESGVVAEAVEERLDIQSRRVLIDFLERPRLVWGGRRDADFRKAA